jgi:hypothetical protein
MFKVVKIEEPLYEFFKSFVFLAESSTCLGLVKEKTKSIETLGSSYLYINIIETQ